MKGQVFKIHSDFYYVNTQNGVVECKVKDVLKKQKLEILVGDFVELEQYIENANQAFISKLLERSNFISRPGVANISQCIIVSALKNPELDFEQLDRYIALCEFHKIVPVLCFNKEDLTDDSKIIEKIKNIYKKLGYKVVFTSALNKRGITKLLPILKENVSMFCGASGVGKSSIIKLVSDLEYIKTKEVSEKTGKGVHTTRHSEIIEIEKGSAVVDTPGFSHLKFDFLMPYDVQNLFVEFNFVEKSCKFKDCLHISEKSCAILNNVTLFHPSRYNSYKKFVIEAREYKEKVTYSGKKIESNYKYNQNKVMTKISSKKRVVSRRKEKQSIDEES